MGQHILFPAGAILMALLLFGLRVWFKKPSHLMMFLSSLILVGIVQSTMSVMEASQEPFPIQTVSHQNEKLIVQFDTVSLLDYAITVEEQFISITLQWRVDTSISHDYQIALTLQDTATNTQQRRWFGQPLEGRYPTRAWFPGDRVRTTTRLPIAGLLPGRLHRRITIR